MTRDAVTYRDALRSSLFSAFEADETRVLIGEDVAAPGPEGGGVFGVSAGFRDRFGEGRIVNMPISESAFTGMAVGAAMTGLRPVVEIMFCDFLMVAMDPLVSAAAKAIHWSGGRRRLPLVVRTTMGAGDGSGAVHSQSLTHMIASVPGLRVMLPFDPQSAADEMTAALAADQPTVLFEHKGLYGSAHGFPRLGPTDGAGLTPLITGDKVTVVAVSRMVHEAADALGACGDGTGDLFAWSRVDGNTPPAVSQRLADSLAKTGRLLVVDESAALSGLGDALVSSVVRRHFSLLTAAPVLMTPPHQSVPYAPPLEQAWLVGKDKIARQLKRMLA